MGSGSPDDEPGAWFGGRIFPCRCDLSPDGRFLSSFAHKPSAKWAIGDAYVAVSKLPWLTALHATATCGTWTRGYCFTEDEHAQEAPGLPVPYGLQSIPAVQFATERRRGWEEASDCPLAPGLRKFCSNRIYLSSAQSESRSSSRLGCTLVNLENEQALKPA